MFHQDHFQCGQCTKQLTGGIFFEREGRPFCEKCINDTFLLPKCAYCGENIKGKCINALNKNWHPDHFFCSQCGKHFPPGAGFLERDGKAYCEEDYYNMFAPKCGSCDQAITDEVVTALGKSFHANCFVCAEPGCKFPLTNGGSFFDYNGKPYCETHYHAARGSLCGSCQKPITGRCLTAIGKRFHPEHFVCAFCKRQLGTTGAATNQGSQATFKDKDGKPYCIACFMKLYG
jgi:paxillin